MKLFTLSLFASALVAVALIQPQSVTGHDVAAKEVVSIQAVVTVAAANSVSDDDEEKLTIKKIMHLAHKSGLLKKVATDKATAEEKLQLHSYYEAMPALSPPRGEAKSWAEKTAALVEAAKAAVDGDVDAGSKLKSATDCAACHNVHK